MAVQLSHSQILEQTVIAEFCNCRLGSELEEVLIYALRIVVLLVLSNNGLSFIGLYNSVKNCIGKKLLLIEKVSFLLDCLLHTLG